MSKILFIGHLWPEPASSAAGYRTLALLKLFTEQGWQVDFACAADKTDFCADLSSFGIASHPIRLNHSSFDQLLVRIKPDMVFFDRFITEEQYGSRIQEQCPEAITILDTQDLHFLRRARQKQVNKSKTCELIDKDLTIGALQTDDAIREIAAILRCDLSLIISRYEMALLTEMFNLDSSLLHYCPFMLSIPEQQNIPSYQQRQHFVMIGNHLHPPNQDAIAWCYQHIWPAIRQQLPLAELHVYGAYPSAGSRQYHQPAKGFRIMGRADNAHQTLAQYRVNLAPLRFGAGIKGKIVDGFISRTPCVTTTTGAEGIDLTSCWGGVIAQNREEFVNLAVNLYQQQALWEQCSENGARLVKKLFSESEHGSRLVETIITLQTRSVLHRQNNFIGKILRHQLYRSSYYMTKWIEAKNTANKVDTQNG